ncbi:MAG: hypothetical protein WCL20_09190 [Actinomycetes bacterium]
MSHQLANAAYWNGPWPAEDGGPERLQAPTGEAGPEVTSHEQFELLANRHAPGAQMAVRRGPGELYLLRSLFGHRAIDDPAQAVVERINPLTLEPINSSPILPAGPWWAGGVAVMADGNLTLVSGSFAHRLDGDSLEVLASRELSAPRPYNSFVALSDGTIITKDIDRSLSSSCRVHALDPSTLEDLCDPVELGESAIARLSADGSSVYSVATDHVYRLDWDGTRLTKSSDWNPHYRKGDGKGYGWDPVLAAGRIWFLDQGRHRFRISMRGSGLDHGPVALHAIDLADASNHFQLEISGSPFGSVTNPPLVDPDRMIAVGYDSAGGHVRAFDIPTDPAIAPTPRWSGSFHTGPHLMRFPDSGELVLFDHRAPWPLHTRAGSRLLESGLSDHLRRSGERKPEMEAKLAKLIGGEDVALVDIETGVERSRARLPVFGQSVAFPTAGENRDLITANFNGVQRVGVR